MAFDQYAYRLRNDDGDQAAATWLAAENTVSDAAYGVNLRVRMGIDLSGGSTLSAAVNCAYKITGEDWWHALDPSATLTYSAFSYTGGSGAISTTTSVTPLVASTATPFRRLLLMLVAQKPATANTGGITEPAGWLTAGSSGYGGGYGGTTGADVGNMQIKAFWQIRQSDADPVFTLADNSVTVAEPVELDNLYGDATWSIAAVAGEDTVGDGTFNGNFGSDPGVQAGDIVLVVHAVSSDAVTGFTGQAITQSGVTYGAVSELFDIGTASGNDMRVSACWALATAGTSSGNPAFSATVGGTTTNARGPALFIRIRGTGHQRVIAALSSHLSTNGTTTAQLTPPTGKTAVSDFDAGRYVEGGSQTPSITISADDYSEAEFVAQPTLLALGEDVGFRLSRGNTEPIPFDTYTHIPTITVIDPNAVTVRNLPFFMG